MSGDGCVGGYVWVCVCEMGRQCFMPPQIWGGELGGGGELTWPPQKKFLGGGRAPPQKDGALTSCGGPNGQFLPQNQGKNGQIFPLAPKARGIPQRAYNSLQIRSNLRKNGTKTQKLLQKCPWWRKSVHIASKTLKTTPKYVKTALRAPKARAKNFPQNLPPPPSPPPQNFYLGGARRPRWRDPYMKHW